MFNAGCCNLLFSSEGQHYFPDWVINLSAWDAALNCLCVTFFHDTFRSLADIMHDSPLEDVAIHLSVTLKLLLRRWFAQSKANHHAFKALIMYLLH